MGPCSCSFSLFVCCVFSPFFKQFAMRGIPQKAPGDLPGQLWGSWLPGGAICCHFWSPFWTHFGTLGVKVVTPGAPRDSFGAGWSFLVTFLDTFWHPWGQGGPPGRTRGLPLGTFGTTFVAPGDQKWSKVRICCFCENECFLIVKHHILRVWAARAAPDGHFLAPFATFWST